VQLDRLVQCNAFGPSPHGESREAHLYHHSQMEWLQALRQALVGLL